MHGPMFFRMQQVTCRVATLQNGVWRVALLWRRRGCWEVALHHRQGRTTQMVILTTPISVEQMLALEEELGLEREFEQEDGNVVAKEVIACGRLHVARAETGGADCVLIVPRPLEVSLHGELQLPQPAWLAEQAAQETSTASQVA